MALEIERMKKALESLAHFALLGLGLGYLIGPFAIPLYLIRELTDWKWMPWPFKGQWPPGNPVKLPSGQKVTPMDRVEDLRWDLIETLSGYAIGQALSIWL